MRTMQGEIKDQRSRMEDVGHGEDGRGEGVTTGETLCGVETGVMTTRVDASVVSLGKGLLWGFNEIDGYH